VLTVPSKYFHLWSYTLIERGHRSTLLAAEVLRGYLTRTRTGGSWQLATGKVPGTLLMCIAIKSGLRVLFTQRRELHNLAGGFWYGLLWFPKGQQYSGIAIRLLHVASVADR